MNPGQSPKAAAGANAAGGFTVDDAIFTLFRHKWLILAFVCLGVLGAVAVRFVKPPLYMSKAKLMVNYVVNSKELAPTSPDGPRGQSLDAGAQSILNAEIEILTSLDVAASVADTIGPARILAKKGGGTNRMMAAALICSGIEVEPPKSSILTISFKHPDRDLVQPALEAVLKAYMLKHRDVRLMSDEYLVQQLEETKKKLAQTEQELKTQKVLAKMPFPEEASRSFQRQIAKLQDDLLDAQRELLERKALRGDKPSVVSGPTNNVVNSVPPDKLASYGAATTRLEELKRQHSELLLQFTEAHPLVLNLQGRIDKLTRQKVELETQCPGLTNVLVSTPQLGTNNVGIEFLTARVEALGTMLSNEQAQASQAMDLEPKIADIKRRLAEEQRAYDSIMARMDQQHRDESLVAGKVMNMSQVQSPTPPGQDFKKMLKLVGIVLVGCIGMGLGLAFLIDLFLDRSLKRSSEIERHLGLPVFLTIPDTALPRWFRLPSWLGLWRRVKRPASNGAAGKENQDTTALAPWDPANQLLTYTEGLRERIISYFEVHNLNHKKPKLVAVTGCNSGAGVTTLASGLAAALSKTGDGNVLLVDMNVDQGVAHSFYKGKPGCGITDALEPDNRADAQVEENLFVATLNHGANNQLAKVLPSRFNQLMPRLKASDYDYIIFDMPPVTQTSATPRLASYMDLALLVLESEKTSQHSAIRASALMREARANVAAVLNKHRSPVPAILSQE